MKNGQFLPVLFVLSSYIVSAVCSSVLDADKKHHMKSKLCYLCHFPRGPSFPRDLLCYLISLLHVQSIPILTYIRHIQYQLSEN